MSKPKTPYWDLPLSEKLKIIHLHSHVSFICKYKAFYRNGHGRNKFIVRNEELGIKNINPSTEQIIKKLRDLGISSIPETVRFERLDDVDFLFERIMEHNMGELAIRIKKKVYATKYSEKRGRR